LGNVQRPQWGLRFEVSLRSREGMDEGRNLSENGREGGKQSNVGDWKEETRMRYLCLGW
jgi:hypothetical protein